MIEGIFEPTYTALPDNLVLSDKSGHPVKCPTCARELYLRPKTLSTNNVHALRAIAKVNIDEKRPAVMDDIEKFAAANIANHARRRSVETTYTGLKYWELIESVTIEIKQANGETEEAQGWKITEAGVAFLNGKIMVPETVWIFDDFTRENPNRGKKFVFVHEVKESRKMNKKIAAQESDTLEASTE